MADKQISSMSAKRNIIEILPSDLSGKLRSKDDFYNYMGQSIPELGTDGYEYRWVDGYDSDDVDESQPLQATG